MINDSYDFRQMIALIFLVRGSKILYDANEEKGYYKSSNWLFIPLAFMYSIFFNYIFMCDNNIFPPSKFHMFNWIFDFQNQPNDKVYGKLLFKRLQI